MKRYLIAFLCAGLLAGCQHNPSGAEQRQQLEARVMDVHDSAMARMGQLFLQRQQLEKRRDSLLQQADTSGLHLLNQHVVALEKADAAMMDWMHQYKAPAEGQAQDTAMNYLQGQLEKIDQVKKQIDSTLAAAKPLTQEHEQKK